jgi:hypothetical protein
MSVEETLSFSQDEFVALDAVMEHIQMLEEVVAEEGLGFGQDSD